MKIKFNNDISIEDVADGKLVIVLKTGEGYFIDDYTFGFFKPALTGFIDIEEFYDIDSNNNEINDFINTLIKYKILIKGGDTYEEKTKL